jgi:hypothetical protein
MNLITRAYVTFASQAPNPNPTAPPGLQDAANTFLGWMKWVGLIAGVAGLMACGIQMAAGRRNRSSMAADGATGIPWVLGGLTLISLSAGIAGAILQ